MKCKSSLLAIVLALAAHAGAAELITNGGFEAGAIVANHGDPGSQQLLGGDAATLAGWTVIGDDIAWIGTGNPYGLTPSQGDNFLDLTGWHVNTSTGSGVKQTIATTAGASYMLSFDIGNSINYNYGSNDSLFVTAGNMVGQQVWTTVSGQPSSWEHVTLSFVASGASTDVSFGGGQAVWYIGLDNVSVMAVPEPSSALMLGAGLLGMAAWLRRRRA